MTTVAEKYLQIAKLAKDPANAEVVIDGILTFFGLDYFDLDLGVEYLYTTKVIDYKFRSVLHKAEDMDAIMAWFKEKTGVTDEEIAAAAGCLMLAKQYLGMGHCISGKTYLELAAAKGSEEAIAQLKDMEYAQDMYDLGEHYLAMGHCICSKTYFELAAAKGCPKAAAKLKDMEYAEDMYKLGEHYLGMGHCICGKTYFELAAAKGCPKAAAKLKDIEYAEDMYKLGEQYLAMGHKICSKTYFELAAAKGCPKAAAKLAEYEA